MTVKDKTYFIISKSEIITALLECKENGNAIGIWSATLGSGMFLCTVKDVLPDEDENDIVVILQENELTMPWVNSNVLYLNEIDRIFTFIGQPLPEASSRESI